MAKTDILFGLHAVQAALKSSPDRIQQILVLKGRQDQRIQKITQQAQSQRIPVKVHDRKSLDDLCDGNHQGVIAYTEGARSFEEKDLLNLIDLAEVDPFVLVLDGVTDPHNLGACLRTADAAGVHAVVIPKDNSAGLTEVARKVACGAAETVPLVVVTNLARTLKKLQDKGLWLAGAAGEAEHSIYDVNLTGPRAIVMGAEGKGMRRLTKEICDELIMIPMHGEVSSLNVSVATGVALFEVVRQRGLER